MNINIFKNNAILKGKTPLISSILAGIIISIFVLVMLIMPPAPTKADFANTNNASYVAKVTNEAKKVVKTIKVVITAYSSSWDETTGIPGVSGTVTASGKTVAPEIIANNGLPLGTKVRIPKLFGDKIFVVGDRMNKRMGDHRIDLWFPSKELAINFGVKNAELEILED